MNEKILSNDLLKLKPSTSYHQPIVTHTFSNIKVGIASYEEGPTGCTTFLFNKKISMVTDKRGGSVGVVNDYFTNVDAICFAGGSLYGYEAFTGVTAELLKMIGYKPDFDIIPAVAGAIIYDLLPRGNTIYPDKELGKASVRDARNTIIPIGAQGAGRSATVGKGLNFMLGEASGQGAAFKEFDDIKILSFVVVNAIGAIKNKEGKTIRGFRDKKTGKRVELKEQIHSQPQTTNTVGNTTLSLVITNIKLERYIQQQIAKQIHSSMSQMIEPFHTLSDGDTLFFVTTNELEKPDFSYAGLGYLASELMWDAVISSIPTNS